MRLDFSSVSSKSAGMWFELWDKMSIQQKNLFVNLSFKKVQPNPQLFTVWAELCTNNCNITNTHTDIQDVQSESIP